MQIRIPRRIASYWDAFCRWGDGDVIGSVRRIDLLLALLGIFCIGYYGWTGGWQGALLGGAMYILMVMIALFF